MGKNLITVMEDIYAEHGYYSCNQNSFYCEGQSGMKKIADTMSNLRNNPPKEICGVKVSVFKDFGESVSLNLKTGQSEKINLPKSNVLGFYLENDASVIVRPSGTEPKIKLYTTAVGNSLEASEQQLTELTKAGTKLLNL